MLECVLQLPAVIDEFGETPPLLSRRPAETDLSGGRYRSAGPEAVSDRTPSLSDRSNPLPAIYTARATILPAALFNENS